jgi:Flp pilus assembly protein protease CpaA
MMIFKIFVSIFLVWVSVHDIKHRRIENFVHIVIVCAAFFLTEISIIERAIGLIFCFIPIGFVSIATDKIGMGDAKLSAAFGFVLGVYKGLTCLILGLLLMTIISGIYLLIIRKNKFVPIAPYLCTGFLIFIFLN